VLRLRQSLTWSQQLSLTDGKLRSDDAANVRPSLVIVFAVVVHFYDINVAVGKTCILAHHCFGTVVFGHICYETTPNFLSGCAILIVAL